MWQYLQSNSLRWRRSDSLILVALFVFALLVRLTNISFPNEKCFDEIYYVSGTQDYLEGRPDANNVHPPLAKIQLAACFLLFDVTKVWGLHHLPDTLGWRLGPALFGAAVVVAAAWLAFAISSRARIAHLSAALVAIDHLSVSEARIVTLDTVQTFWITLGLAAAAHYHFRDRRWRWVTLSAIALGIATGCKWNGLFPLGAVFLALSGAVGHPGSVDSVRQTPPAASTETGLNPENAEPQKAAAETEAPPSLPPDPVSPAQRVWHSLRVGLTLGLATAVIYSASYIPYWNLNRHKPLTTVVSEIVGQHKRMVNFRKDPKQFKHTYLSHFYQWPFVIRPVWFHFNSVPSKNPTNCTGIVAFGLLPFWWLSIYLVIEATVFSWQKRSWDPAGQFLALAYLTQWLLWASSTTGGFFYYMLPAVPIMATLVARQIENWRALPAERNWAYFYLAVLAISFLLYFPFMTGISVPYRYFQTLFFARSWV